LAGIFPNDFTWFHDGFQRRKLMTAKSPNNNTLGSTARWTAAARALESIREDRLFDDPWATALAGPEGSAWIANRPPESLTPMVLRIRFFDDFLQRITGENSITQVVLLAAGLDTRAFRLNWPEGTSLFELDQPSVLQEKEQILRSAGAHPTCTRHIIETDLTNPWRKHLIESGFDPTKPSAWLLEGFLFYIPTRSITAVLEKVNFLSTRGSWLGFDIINSITLTSPHTRQWIEMQAGSGAPWVGAMDDPVGFLATRGWKAALSQAGAPDANHARWHLPVIPVAMPDMPHNWFVTAQKEGR
jgi:methyltransferase (TIGR00027 family)